MRSIPRPKRPGYPPRWLPLQLQASKDPRGRRKHVTDIARQSFRGRGPQGWGGRTIHRSVCA
eukprot:5035635-Alexandrium_andersonii.AAC.1